MRVYKLRLVNYIGIYNGMGIDKIEIDFSKCRNKITVIKGDNGSGKSTVFKAINPFPDATSSLIPKKAASKYIAYQLNNGDILHITYNYPIDYKGDRKPNNCTLIYEDFNGNKKDLLPNKNINEGKSIICDLLDIDSGFLTLAQLSSDDRGLADKTPSQRKAFINAKISQLDAFNDIYKKLAKKASNLRSMVTSLNAKISSLGDIRSIQANIEGLEKHHGNLEDTKVALISEISRDQVEYERSTKIIENAYDIKRKYSDLNSIITSLDYKSTWDNESLLDAANTKLSEYKQEIAVCESSMIDINREKQSISDKISKAQIKLDSIGDIDSIEDLENHIVELKQSYQSAKKKFDSIGFNQYDSVSTEEYDYAVSTIMQLNNWKNEFDIKYGDSITIDNIFDIEEKIAKTPNYLRALDERISYEKNQIKKSEDFISEQVRLANQAKGYNDIPTNCPNKTTCPFIKSIADAKSQLFSQEKLDKIQENINIHTKVVETLTRQYEIYSSAHEASFLVKSIITTIDNSIKILSKFPIHIDSDKNRMIRSFLTSGTGFNIDLKPYIEWKNLFSIMKSTKQDLLTLEKQYDIIKPNIELATSLKKDIDSLNKEYESASLKYNNLSIRKSDAENYIPTIERNIKEVKENQAKKEKYDEYQKQKKELEKKISEQEQEVLKATEIDKRMNDKKSKLDHIISIDIPNVQKVINENNYKLVLYDDYTKEYQKYSAEYSRIEKIKYYCSPTTGIQTIFMEMYMNKVIGISNQLLSMFFGGEFMLQPFVVNEKEFRMPVLGNGILNDDISSMSTSQVCMISMILSFALLHESSSIYNIIKIDEIEGGLDTHNRLAFFGVLNNLMDTLNYNQCIMISHNTELNMSSMDVIVLKNTDPAAKFEGNIIFDLKNYRG